MNFQSLHFLAFLIVIFAANQALLANFKWRKNMLLCASYYFYACWDWRFCSLIILVTLVNFVAGARIARSTTQFERKTWLVFALTVCLGVLAYFKYAGFFLESLVHLFSTIGWKIDPPTLTLLLPIGISFFTFQSLSYVLDVYRGQEEPCADLRDFALFVAFFPTLLAGPITRARQLLPQLAVQRPYKPEDTDSGLAFIIRGFIKKVAFADVIAAQWVNPAFADPSQFSPWFLLLALYGYTFQIYMDFSGYTDIARGVAKMLGFHLPENFNRPYLANSLSNFWQRWHMSMSSFFRDYLFFGLGGSRHGNIYMNLMITFVAIGLWHGAGWNFIAYGFVHGGVVGFERWRRNRREEKGLEPLVNKGWSWVIRVFVTLNIVIFSRVLFRAPDFQGAYKYLEAMTNFNQDNFPATELGIIVLSLSIFLHYIPSQWSNLFTDGFKRLPVPAQGFFIAGTAMVLMALSSGQPQFVYFAF